MRFGIMAMQLDMLVPPGMPAAEVMASVLGFDHACLASDLFAAGFNPVELGGDLAIFLPHTFGAEAIQNLAALRTDGRGFTVHLPLWSVEPSTPLAPVRQGSVQAVVDCIRAVAPLAPEVYVLHATGALAAEFFRMRISDVAKAVLLRQFQGAARESIRRILAETGIPSRKLAIETVEFPWDLTWELAEELDLSICFDAGHVLAAFPGWLDFDAMLEQVLPRLAEVHFHDCPRMTPPDIGYGKDHQPLGAGDLDVGAFLDRLHAAGFQGPLVYELTLPQAQASMDVVRRLRPQYLPA